MPALIRRFHEAARDGLEQVAIWGTGTPRREFLHVDDMAEASLFVLNLPLDTYQANTEPMLSHINVGYGEDVTIRDLAQLVAEITGYTGEVVFDTTKPDGTMRKLMDSGRLTAMGWKPSVALADGVRETYEWFLANAAPLGSLEPVRH
jgi:nucleoside-diphosphate-sugar epimerase